VIAKMRDDLQDAFVKLELRNQDVERLAARDAAYLEGELKLQSQHRTNALKESILLKQPEPVFRDCSASISESTSGVRSQKIWLDRLPGDRGDTSIS
jgi:hypothetical protein